MTELLSYNRTAAAIEIAVEQANAYILPANVQVKLNFRDAGPDCYSVQGPIVGALDLVTKNIQCHVYVGPGSVYHDCSVLTDAPLEVETLISMLYFRLHHWCRRTVQLCPLLQNSHHSVSSGRLGSSGSNSCRILIAD